MEEETWTILELAERAADALAGTGPSADEGMPSGPERANGRVRDVPNERLVRWYVTVGLVDPPLSRRGRVARYGRRHLLQLVAVKRRQAQGRSLAEIQAELAGATDEALAAVARVPGIGPEPQALPAAQARFWARQPHQPGQPSADDERPVGTVSPPARLVHGVMLAPGVTLLLADADHAPSPDDVTGIADAAAPLLRELASRRLRACGPGHPPDVNHLESDSSPRGTGHDH